MWKRTWCRIIADPAFAKQHVHRGIGQDLLFHTHYKSGKIFLLPIKELIYSSKRKSRIHCVDATNVNTLMGPCIRYFPVPSCNGLLLLCNDKNNMSWRIWNPFTGDYLELRQCEEFINVKDQIVCSAIGYDEANDDYKVVKIVGIDTYIYSVNTKKWRKIEDFPASLNVHAGGVFALDLSTEKYRKIVFPSEIIHWRGLELTALSGCLFLVHYYLNGTFVMWMIQDYGCQDTWIKLISLEKEFFFEPLAYLKGKEQVLLHFNKREYLWYDVEKKCSERLSIEVNTNGFDDESDCYKYINDKFYSQVIPVSLIRLNRSDVSDERVSLQRKFKRKRESAMAIERLPLKLTFEDLDDIACDDDEHIFSDKPDI